MTKNSNIRHWIFGAIFGAWLGLVFALTSQVVNWLLLPNIPLMAPGGSLAGYLLRYALMAGLLGLVSSIPDHWLGGAALGGFASAVVLSVVALWQEREGLVFLGAVITIVITFLPLMVFMMPVSYLLRAGVDAQDVDPSRPYLWARRYLIPLFLTLVVVIVGSLSLHDKEARKGFRQTNELVQQGLAATSEDTLPKPLKDVRGFMQDAKGPYRLEWSDRVDTFFGPRPAGAEMSQFLIIARFDNGFSFACVFSSNRTVPNCTNY